MTPTEELRQLAKSRGVTLVSASRPSEVWIDVYRGGKFLYRCANVAECTGFVSQLYTPEETKHFNEVNAK